jgi:hypothetical protein
MIGSSPRIRASQLKKTIRIPLAKKNMEFKITHCSPTAMANDDDRRGGGGSGFR